MRRTSRQEAVDFFSHRLAVFDVLRVQLGPAEELTEYGTVLVREFVKDGNTAAQNERVTGVSQLLIVDVLVTAKELKMSGREYDDENGGRR